MTSQRRRTVVLVDDHPVVLAGLRGLIDGHSDFKVVATCSGGLAGLEALRRECPDLAVVDINMPDIDGLAVLAATKTELQTRIVLLAASLTDRQIFDAVTEGAWGLLLKEWAATTLVDCLTAVGEGRRYMPAEFVGPAVERELKRREAGQQLLHELSRRELEILRLVADGLHSKSIAGQLNITDGTLKIHLNRVYKKLGVSSRAELVSLAHDYRDLLG